MSDLCNLNPYGDGSGAGSGAGDGDGYDAGRGSGYGSGDGQGLFKKPPYLGGFIIAGIA